MKDEKDKQTVEAFPDFVAVTPTAPLDFFEAAKAHEIVAANLIPKPIGYRIIVKPKPASDKIGSLYMAARTKNTDLATRTVGQVVAVGALVFTGVLDGIDYNKDPVAQALKPGDWVIYRQHGAQKIKIGTIPGEFGEEDQDECLLIMSDTDIFAALTPAQAEQIYDWVS